MEDRPPNIVFLVMDTARASNFSCYGHERATTPNIDEFAASAVQYNRVTSVSPWTLPSHASLFTGVPPTVHGMNSLDSMLSDDLLTLPELLSSQGYTTVGMAANPWLSSEFGVIRGFDRFDYLFGPLATDSYREFTSVLTDQSLPFSQRIKRILSNQNLVDVSKNCVTAAYRQLIGQDDDGASVAVDRGLDVIKNRDEFMLFINFLEPHLPFQPPSGYQNKFLSEDVTDKRLQSLNHDAPAYNIRNVEMSDEDFELLERLYDAEISYVDKKIGELLKALDEQGIKDNTIIVIIGDHGENIGDHGLMAHHYSVHETLTHVPLLIHYPDEYDAQSTSQRNWSLDVPATFHDILSDYGLSNDRFADQQFGMSLLSNDIIERPVYAEYLNPMPPIDTMAERCQNSGFSVSTYDRTLRAVYKNRFKFVRRSDGEKMLYNLDKDPVESQNIIKEHNKKAHEMEECLDDWIQACETNDTGQTQIGDQIESRLSDLGYL